MRGKNTRPQRTPSIVYQSPIAQSRAAILRVMVAQVPNGGIQYTRVQSIGILRITPDKTIGILPIFSLWVDMHEGTHQLLFSSCSTPNAHHSGALMLNIQAPYTHAEVDNLLHGRTCNGTGITPGESLSHHCRQMHVAVNLEAPPL